MPDVLMKRFDFYQTNSSETNPTYAVPETVLERSLLQLSFIKVHLSEPR